MSDLYLKFYNMSDSAASSYLRRRQGSAGGRARLHPEAHRAGGAETNSAGTSIDSRKR